MYSSENVNNEFIIKVRIAINEILLARIKFRAMFDGDTKNLTDILNRIQTDNKILMEFIRNCVIYDTTASEIPRTAKMECNYPLIVNMSSENVKNEFIIKLRIAKLVRFFNLGLSFVLCLMMILRI